MDDEKKDALQAKILEAIGAKPDEVEKIELHIVWKLSKHEDESKQS